VKHRDHICPSLCLLPALSRGQCFTVEDTNIHEICIPWSEHQHMRIRQGREAGLLAATSQELGHIQLRFLRSLFLAVETQQSGLQLFLSATLINTLDIFHGLISVKETRRLYCRQQIKLRNLWCWVRSWDSDGI
jgi:hypothetical protein